MRDNSLIDPEPGFGPAYCFVNQTNFAFIFIRGTVCQCMDLYGTIVRGTVCQCMDLNGTIVRIRSFIANRCFAAGIPNKQGPSGPPADGGPARPCEYYISSLQADLDNLPRCCTDSDRYPWAVSDESLWLVPRTRRGWVTVGTCRLPLPRLHVCLFHPLRAGLAHGVHLHAWNQVLDPGHRHRAPVRAPRPSHHRSGAGAAYLSPRHAGRAVVRGHKAVARCIWFVSHIFARCVSQTYGHATSTTCKNVRQNLTPRATA